MNMSNNRKFPESNSEWLGWAKLIRHTFLGCIVGPGTISDSHPTGTKSQLTSTSICFRYESSIVGS